MGGVKTWPSLQAENFFDISLKICSRYKRLSSGGDYAEKHFKYAKCKKRESCPCGQRIKHYAVKAYGGVDV
jgi:hypothetical protein